MKHRIKCAAAALLLPLLLSVVPAGALAEGGQQSTARAAFSPAAVGEAAAAACPEGYAPAAENERMALYVDTARGRFACFDKRTGQTWYSVPPAAADGETEEQLRVRSMLYIEYADEQGNAYRYSSVQHGLERGELTVEMLPDGAAFCWTLTDNKRSIDDVPEFISVSRFERYFLSAATDEEKKILQKRFVLSADGSRWCRYAIPPFELKKLYALMDRTGYGSEELAVDRQENADLWQNKAEIVSHVAFNIEVQVSLDGEDVVVRVPAGKIECSAGYHLTALRAAEYFGATRGESGSLLIPDGSGALIAFGSGASGSGEVSVSLYGTDAVTPQQSQVFAPEHVSLPVFGICRETAGLLGIVEDGRSLAAVAACAAPQSSFDRICVQFSPQQQGKVQLDNDAAQTVFEPAPYTGDLAVRYCFTSGGSGGYPALAALCRERLLAGRGRQAAGSMPAYLQLLGSVDKKRQLLFFSYFGNEVLTDYAQAAAITDELTAAGTENLQVRYSGLLRGGLRHTTALSPKRNRSLGSAAELTALADRLRQNGGRLYADVSIVRVMQSGRGFRYSRDGARALSQRAQILYRYAPVTGLAIEEDSLLSGIAYDYVLSPRRLTDAATKTAAMLNGLGVDGLYLSDLGSLVLSDQKKSAPIDRESSRALTGEALAALSGNALLGSGGSAELLSCAGGLLDIPLADTGYAQTERSIPFLAMVLHGYIDYAGVSVDRTADAEGALLDAIEQGASLQFCVMAAPAEALADTGYTGYHAVSYTLWRDKMTVLWQQVDTALSACRGQTIVDHTRTADGLSCTTYENGIRIYVNRGKTAVDVAQPDGTTVTVPARGWQAAGPAAEGRS